MTIGFRAANKTESVGALSGFNVWSYAVIAEEILRMSYGCGNETGNAKAWHTIRQELKRGVTLKLNRTCNDRKGESFKKFRYSQLSNYKQVLVIGSWEEITRNKEKTVLLFPFVQRLF